jgi:dipeptidyl aminopeptidase/acylaminoacyl peptidase
MVFLAANSRKAAITEAVIGDLHNGNLIPLGESTWGNIPVTANIDYTKAILIDHYTLGDHVLFIWEKENRQRRILYGTPLEQRDDHHNHVLNSISHPHFTRNDQGLLFRTSLFDDEYGAGYIPLSDPGSLQPVSINGVYHTGEGELTKITHLNQTRYLLEYNIDGSSWLYEAQFDEQKSQLSVQHVICGLGLLSNGVLESVSYEKERDIFILSHSTATSPTQIYTVEGEDRDVIFSHTNEQILGIENELLSPGEDASYISFDGIRISARLYRPSPKLGFTGARPLVYYIHGGPQSQERPDFAWFSMPLIQFLTLNGFTVFVPNVRGSIGYGLNYTKQVDHDWGGKDREDHVHAMQAVLPQDKLIDTKRAGVVGRSYGGYMTLTLAGRHNNLWSAAVDMFGPYDLKSFMARIPETWKPYFKITLGDPENPLDQAFLTERSPKNFLDAINCPLLVIQGRNDPRVIEQESRDLVDHLHKAGKQVEYLVFENEGHDILKYNNRVTCYNRITSFLVEHLRP